jgi:serine/threonine protein kinase
MPWLDGMNLQSRLAADGWLPLRTALWIARQAAEALDGFHAVGWVHGDVTPGNIHLAPNGHVTLLDLSFARRGDEVESAAHRRIMGTCNYIAPEQLTSTLRTDIRGDIYGLGAVLYEMLCGRPPYEATDLADLIAQHRQSAPPELVRLAPHVPREVLALVRQMLAKEPMRRPQTPHELRQRLAALEIAAISDHA